MDHREFERLDDEASKILKKIKSVDEYNQICKKYDFLFDDTFTNYEYSYIIFFPPKTHDPENKYYNDTLWDYWIQDVMGNTLVYLDIPLRGAYLSARPDYIEKFNIKEKEIPTFILFKNGKEIKRFEGLYTKISDLISAYNENM
jgi:hypothetical protein